MREWDGWFYDLLGLASPFPAEELLHGVCAHNDELEFDPVAYEKKIVLRCPAGYKFALDQMVEGFLEDGVALVAVIGKDCARIEDIIDELIVGDGSNPERFIVTTSHPDESLQDVVEFAELFWTDTVGKVQIVEL